MYKGNDVDVNFPILSAVAHGSPDFAHGLHVDKWDYVEILKLE